jgi:hypothetical protein
MLSDFLSDVLHHAFAQHPRVVEAAGKRAQQQGKSGALVSHLARGKDAPGALETGATSDPAP